MDRISETDLILRPDGSAFHIGLHANQIPDRIIGVGDPDRVDLVSRHFNGIDFKQHQREFVSLRGRYNGKDILVISTGIGTDNVEIVLTELDALINIDPETRLPRKVKRKLSIVRVGTSGGMQPEIKAGSMVASVYGIGLDNLMTFYRLPQSPLEKDLASAIQLTTGINFTPYLSPCSKTLLDKIGFDMIPGNTVTCPGFYAPQGRRVRLAIQYPNLLNDLRDIHIKDFRLTNFEMETSAYYALGNLLGHDVLSVSAILLNRSTQEFATDAETLMDKLIGKVLDRI